MGRSDEYRRYAYAAECLEMASVVHDPKTRATLLMAQVWLRLAGQRELQDAEEKFGLGEG